MNYDQQHSKYESDHLPEIEYKILEDNWSAKYGSLATVSLPSSQPLYMISTNGKKVDPTMFIAEDLDNLDNWLNKF